MDWLLIILFFVFLSLVNSQFKRTFYRYPILSVLISLMVFVLLILGAISWLAENLDTP